jgi:hypothetical protein
MDKLTEGQLVTQRDCQPNRQVRDKPRWTDGWSASRQTGRQAGRRADRLFIRTCSVFQLDGLVLNSEHDGDDPVGVEKPSNGDRWVSGNGRRLMVQ